MPWNRNEPDPLEAKRKQLAEQERALEAQRRLLSEQLRTGDLPGGKVKPSAPLVWRREDDEQVEDRDIEPTPARKRHLARQRNRDMVLFFIFIAVLLVVIVVVLWVAYVHNTPALPK